MVFGRILLLKANVFWVARTNRKFSAVYNLKKLEYCLVLVTRILTPNPKKWSQYDMQAPKVLDFLEKLISKFFNFYLFFLIKRLTNGIKYSKILNLPEVCLIFY
jgi:hypothetical protein